MPSSGIAGSYGSSTFSFVSVQFSRSVMSDSVTPWTAARQVSLSITNSQSLPKVMSIESAMPSNYLLLCCPLLLLPSIFPSIRVFQISQFFTLGAKVLEFQVQHQFFQFPLGWTGWISLQSKGFSRVFSNNTAQKHQFFGTQLF